MLKYSIGIDVSKNDFHCCISVIDKQQEVSVKSSHKFPNTVSGFKELHQWAQKWHKDKSVWLVVVMEATGVYHENLALFLTQKDYYVSVVLPNKAKKYLQAGGAKSKNDKIDAKGLAHMGAEQHLEVWSPLSKYFYTLRSLTRQHQNLQELKTVIKNRLEALEHSMYKNKDLIKDQKSLLTKFESQLNSIEKAIGQHICENEEIKKKVGNLCRIKGLGLLTVAVILAETNGFELFENGRQLVSYAGYDVIENQSGNHVGKTRISKKGNSRIRRILFMPAFSVVTYRQTPFIGLFERTFAKHKMKMKSYVAVQKKLLVVIYSIWKNGQAYELNYETTKYTGEMELGPSSLHGLEQANTENKNSTIKGDGATQGRHTVEIPEMASSLQL